MAQYEHLPIYKAAFDLNLYVEQIVRNFSRYHKYTLGTELRERSLQRIREWNGLRGGGYSGLENGTDEERSLQRIREWNG